MTPLLPVLLCALAAAARAAPEHCGLPKERGSCNRFAVNYYYDTEYGGCLRFWYGGCDGNGNRFASEAECERACVSPPGDELCRLPAVRGACKRAKTRWHSDAAGGGCRQFTYSGCLGNDNRFESESACQQRCGAVSPDSGSGGSGGGSSGGVQTTPAAPGPADCLLPERVSGDCNKYVIRYSYMAARQQCAPFYYGGCGGNANRFDTPEVCAAACVKKPTTRPPYYAPQDRDRFAPQQYDRVDQPSYGRVDQPTYGRDDQPSSGRVDQPSYGRDDQPSYGRDDQPSSGRDDQPSYGRDDRPSYGRVDQPSYGRDDQPSYGRVDQPTYGRDDQPSPGRDDQPSPGRDDQPSYGRVDQPTYGRDDQPSYGRDDQPSYGRDDQPTYGRDDQPSYGRNEDRPEPTEASRRPFQPQTEATQRPVQPETEAPYVPYQPVPEPAYQPEPEIPDTPAPTADICSLPADGGNCRAYMPSYSFNAGHGRCERFIYGGCGGNENRFSSPEACMERCGGPLRPEVQPTEPPTPSPQPETEPPETEAPDAYIPLPTAAPNVCELSPVGGSCDQRLQRHYFNTALRRCFTFVFSGCGGNGNNFASAAECQARCQPGEAIATQLPFFGGGFGFNGGGGGGTDAAVETTTLADDYPAIDYSAQDYGLQDYGLGGIDGIDTGATESSNYYDEYYADNYDDYEEELS